MSNFYDEEKNKLISSVMAHRAKREDLLAQIIDIEKTKLTRDQISRLKTYLDHTLEDEQIVSNRLWGKPVERVQEIERCLIIDN